MVLRVYSVPAVQHFCSQERTTPLVTLVGDLAESMNPSASGSARRFGYCRFETGLFQGFPRHLVPMQAFIKEVDILFLCTTMS